MTTDRNPAAPAAPPRPEWWPADAPEPYIGYPIAGWCDFADAPVPGGGYCPCCSDHKE